MASPSWSNGEDFDTATWMDGHPRETPSMERDLELALRIAEEDIILRYVFNFLRDSCQTLKQRPLTNNETDC